MFTQARKTTHGLQVDVDVVHPSMDNIKTWIGLPVEESVRMTEGRDKWRKYVHGVTNPRIENRTELGQVKPARQ